MNSTVWLCTLYGATQLIVALGDVQKAGCTGNNITGAGVSSGIYLYRITSGSGYTQTKRMTLLK